MAPPRKKTKLSSRAASSPSLDTPKETTPAAATKVSREEKATTRPLLDPDPWTDDQEAALFKSIVRYKPVGLHRHVRMYCILANLRRYGWTDEHISREGVWRKLDTLYNMEALHEREDADELEREDNWAEFWLPAADFGEDMFARRISGKRSSSPPTLNHQLGHQDKSDTLRKSAASTRKRGRQEDAPENPTSDSEDKASRDEPKRALRGKNARGGRSTNQTPNEANTRKRKRAETPPTEQGNDDEEEESDQGDDGDEEDEEEEDGTGEEEDEAGDEAEGEEGSEEEEAEDEDEDEEEDEPDEGGEEDAEQEPATRSSRGGRARAGRGSGRRRPSAPAASAGTGARSGRGGRTKAARGGRGGRGRGAR